MAYHRVADYFLAKTNSMELLIASIKRKMDTEFETGGYLLKHTHFENGKNLHSGQYYFAKKFFQNSSNCDKISTLVVEKLNELKIDEATTLIGFRNYSGLFLNKVVAKSEKYNYAIIEQEGSEFVWQHLPILKNKLLIILPVTCTCSTYIKLRKFILDYVRTHLNRPDIEVEDQFINIFLILEKALQPLENEKVVISDHKDASDEKMRNIYQIYSAFNWTQIQANQILFNNNEGKEYFANPIVKLYSEMYLPESCPLCFPEIRGQENEKPLFPTHDNYETPNLIFGFPNFSRVKEQSDFYTIFSSDERYGSTHLYGHITVNKSSYTNYIRGNAFYEKNKPAILAYFNDQLKQHLRTEDTEIIFITAENKHNSKFIEDISISEALLGKSITILPFEPSNEFVDNFISLHSNSISTPGIKVIYFEDVMSAGKTFKLISNYLKHAKKESPNKVGRHGFDLVLTLVDRTPLFTYDEILKKLHSEKNNNEEANASRFICFYKLNVPIISATHMGDPPKRRIRDLQRLQMQCYLDTVRSGFCEELILQHPKLLPELDRSKGPGSTFNYFPFSDIEVTLNEECLQVYSHYLARDKSDLLKLFLTHELNSELAKEEYGKIGFFEKHQDDPKGLIVEIIFKIQNKIRNSVFRFFVREEAESSPLRNLKIEEEIVHDTIVKILSRYPFTYYKNIFTAIFGYCSYRLMQIHKGIEKDGLHSFHIFRQLKFYIKRLVDLNSNFIISERFLSCIKVQYHKSRNVQIKKHYSRLLAKLDALRSENKISAALHRTAVNNITYKQSQVERYFRFLLMQFKELSVRNPNRSIRLESLLNSATLLPIDRSSFAENDAGISHILSSPYFHFTGMLKAENSILLTSLKELHQQNVKRQLLQFSGDELPEHLISRRSILSYYFKKKKNDPIILSALKLISHSRYAAAGLTSEAFLGLKYSVCNMLYTAGLLERKKNRKDFHRADFDLDIELNEIITSLLKILAPEQQEFWRDQGKSSPQVPSTFLKDTSGFDYAFFVEYRKKSKYDRGSENIYAITNDPSKKNQRNLMLNPQGLLYRLLYGLYDDKDCRNVQSFLACYKADNAAPVSFAEKYYFKLENEVRHETFEEMLKKDHFNEETGTGLKLLDHARMAMLFRFANFEISPEASSGLRIEGQAVLVIVPKNNAPKTSFWEFVSNEKVRLVLLLKTELLAYLQKQFDNDAFIDVLQRRNANNYQSSLRHGISEYTDHLEYLFDEINQESKISEDKTELFNIIINAIKGQLLQVESSDNIRKQVRYSQVEIVKTIRLLFESTRVGSYKIPFEKVTLTGFSFQHLAMSKVVKEVIIPEVIRNMKKYSPRYGDRRLEIEYLADTNTFFFKNRKASIVNYSSQRKTTSGGLGMIRNILENSKIGTIKTSDTAEDFTLILTLKKAENEPKKHITD